jgi:hypothetical protein
MKQREADFFRSKSSTSLSSYFLLFFLDPSLKKITSSLSPHKIYILTPFHDHSTAIAPLSPHTHTHTQTHTPDHAQGSRQPVPGERGRPRPVRPAGRRGRPLRNVHPVPESRDDDGRPGGVLRCQRRDDDGTPPPEGRHGRGAVLPVGPWPVLQQADEPATLGRVLHLLQAFGGAQEAPPKAPVRLDQVLIQQGGGLPVPPPGTVLRLLRLVLRLVLLQEEELQERAAHDDNDGGRPRAGVRGGRLVSPVDGPFQRMAPCLYCYHFHGHRVPSNEHIRAQTYKHTQLHLHTTCTYFIHSHTLHPKVSAESNQRERERETEGRGGYRDKQITGRCQRVGSESNGETHTASMCISPPPPFDPFYPPLLPSSSTLSSFSIFVHHYYSTDHVRYNKTISQDSIIHLEYRRNLIS